MCGSIQHSIIQCISPHILQGPYAAGNTIDAVFGMYDLSDVVRTLATFLQRDSGDLGEESSSLHSCTTQNYTDRNMNLCTVDIFSALAV
jgi:hypothetical protein